MLQDTSITPEQQAVLARFTCERLTAHEENLDEAQEFKCDRNKHLAEILSQSAWEEDLESRPTIYYVVKNQEGRIALYFSLKCGVLFDPHYVEQVVMRYNDSLALLDALENRETQAWAREHLEEIRAGRGFVPASKEYAIRSKFWNAKNTKLDILDDLERDPNKKLIRVSDALPAVELVHFCVNDKIRAEWKSYDMGHPIGECMFWHFVVPKMQELSQLAGCEYAYLYAADRSADGDLLNYYDTSLHFKFMQHIGAIKPKYDFLCVFMGARLSAMTDYRRQRLGKEVCRMEDPLGLFEYRKAFFESFNEKAAIRKDDYTEK